MMTTVGGAKPIGANFQEGGGGGSGGKVQECAMPGCTSTEHGIWKCPKAKNLTADEKRARLSAFFKKRDALKLKSKPKPPDSVVAETEEVVEEPAQPIASAAPSRFIFNAVTDYYEPTTSTSADNTYFQFEEGQFVPTAPMVPSFSGMSQPEGVIDADALTKPLAGPAYKAARARLLLE